MALFPKLDNLSFMVVDDNDHMRKLVRVILRGLGCDRIWEARNGAGAVRGLSEHLPDILMTDWVMDPMDGLQLTRFIRSAEDSPNPYMPIIMMTGFAERSRVMAARDAGVTEFLVKPLSAQSVFSRINTIVEHPRQFVKVGQYFGPDRRRKDDWAGEERRSTPTHAKPSAQQPTGAMAQWEINQLFNP